MYTLSLHRITLFKTGAGFSEHSPLLHQLSAFPDWKKPHAGLRKMFMGEVAGKRVVVQGVWVGGWTWGEDVPDEQGGKMASQERTHGGGSASQQVVTPAPWSQGRGDSRASVLEATRGDWAGTVPRRR
jgi:serine/threonine-protein phosphatase 2A activator